MLPVRTVGGGASVNSYVPDAATTWEADRGVGGKPPGGPSGWDRSLDAMLRIKYLPHLTAWRRALKRTGICRRTRVSLPILALALTVPLAGCGADENSQNAGASPQKNSEGFSPEVSSITIGITGVENHGLVNQVAIDAGLYKKYGVSVDLKVFEGDGAAAQAMEAGAVDATVTSGAPALASVRADSPNLMVAAYSTTPTDMLVGGVDVKDVGDVKGKQVAVSTFGSDAHISVLLGLEALGLSQDDVTITQVGGQSARVAALAAGAVAAAPVDVVDQATMEDQGFHVLVSLPETDYKLPRMGLVFPKEFIDKNPQTVEAMVAANIEAMELIYKDQQKAAEIFAAWAQVDQAEALNQVKVGLDLLWDVQRCLTMDEKMFTTQQELLAAVDPSYKGIDGSKAFTNSFLDDLGDSGFYEKVGSPCGQ